MASVLERMFGSGGSPMMPQEEAQMRQMTKDNPSEFQDMIPGGAKPKKDSYKAEQKIRGKTGGAQLQQLMKMLQSRGMTEEEALEKIKQMGL